MGNATYFRQLQHNPYCSDVEQQHFNKATAIKNLETIRVAWSIDP